MRKFGSCQPELPGSCGRAPPKAAPPKLGSCQLLKPLRPGIPAASRPRLMPGGTTLQKMAAALMPNAAAAAELLKWVRRNEGVVTLAITKTGNNSTDLAKVLDGTLKSFATEAHSEIIKNHMKLQLLLVQQLHPLI